MLQCWATLGTAKVRFFPKWGNTKSPTSITREILVSVSSLRVLVEGMMSSLRCGTIAGFETSDGSRNGLPHVLMLLGNYQILEAPAENFFCGLFESHPKGFACVEPDLERAAVLEATLRVSRPSELSLCYPRVIQCQTLVAYLSRQ